MKTYLIIIILLLFSPSILFAAECTRQEAIEAETTASSIKSWHELEAHFYKFGHCDDGAIGEGYSESVSYLMEDKWPEFLNYKMGESFFNFAKKHVDETWEINRYKKVAKLASTNCNKSKKSICDEIKIKKSL